MRTLQIITIFKYLLVGLLNTIVGLAVIYSSMFFWKVDPLLSNVIGYVSGFILGYFLNKKWTFRSQCCDKHSFILYLGVILISYLLNVTMVFFAINLNFSPYCAQLIGMICYTSISYVGCKAIIFNKKKDEKNYQ